MVGGIAPIMAETEATGAIDDEGAGKLADIAFGDTHPLSFGHGCQPLDRQAGGQQPGKRRSPKIERREKPLLGIGNHGKGDVEALLEGRCLLTTSESDEHHLSAQPAECLFVATQLRYLMPAERSPIVPQKDQDQRSPRPEAAETGGCFIPQLDVLVSDFHSCQLV